MTIGFSVRHVDGPMCPLGALVRWTVEMLIFEAQVLCLDVWDVIFSNRFLPSFLLRSTISAAIPSSEQSVHTPCDLDNGQAEERRWLLRRRR